MKRSRPFLVLSCVVLFAVDCAVSQVENQDHSGSPGSSQSSVFRPRFGHQYAEVRNGERSRTLTDVLMLPEGGFQLRDKNGVAGNRGVFRYWQLDPKTGQLSFRRLDGSLVEVPADVAEQFRQVMERERRKPEGFDRFLKRLADPTSPAPDLKPAPLARINPAPLAEEAPEIPRTARNKPGQPEVPKVRPKDPPPETPVVPHEAPRTEPRQPPAESVSPAPASAETNPRIDIGLFSNQTRSVVQRFNLGNGFFRDEIVQVPESPRGCGSFLAHSESVGNGQCRNYLVTAAHCVPVAVTQGGARGAVSRVDISLPGQSASFDTKNAEIDVRLPAGEFEDYAIVSLKMPCETLQGRQAKLCSPADNGTVNTPAGSRLTLRTFDDASRAEKGTEVPAHRNGSAPGTLLKQVAFGQWAVRTDVQVPSFTGRPGTVQEKGAVAAGDSGGPVLTESGCVAGVVSQIHRFQDRQGQAFRLANGQTLQGTFFYTFAPRMSKWVRDEMGTMVGNRFARSQVASNAVPRREPAQVSYVPRR